MTDPKNNGPKPGEQQVALALAPINANDIQMFAQVIGQDPGAVGNNLIRASVLRIVAARIEGEFVAALTKKAAADAKADADVAAAEARKADPNDVDSSTPEERLAAYRAAAGPIGLAKPAPVDEGTSEDAADPGPVPDKQPS